LQRAICFDITHMVSRLGISAPTGIDNVDLRLGRHYAEARWDKPSTASALDDCSGH